MKKSEAAQVFLEIQAQLKHEGLIASGLGTVMAALRAEDGSVLFSELTLNGIIAQELDSMDECEPILRAFALKPAAAVLLLSGDYALRVAEQKRRLRAELDDMAQIVGLTARVAHSIEPRVLARCLNQRNSCFVKEKGMLITGRSASEAVTGAILLEKAAMTHILAKKIGGAKRVPLLSAAFMHEFYQKKYSRINLDEENARARTTGQETQARPARTAREQSLREEIVFCGKRLADEGLVQGTWGNISVRLDDAYMLCTPSGLDYRRLRADDIVKVNMRTLEHEGTRRPTSEKRLHRDIFVSRADVGASIHTHAKLCGVFAAARRTICCISGEMQEKVGNEMRCAGHALPSTKKLSRIALKALGNRNGCLLMNHGALCCGADLERAYLTCKAAETAAAEQLGLMETHTI
jgi:L-fuculose-phosphate aldolase